MYYWLERTSLEPNFGCNPPFIMFCHCPTVFPITPVIPLMMNSWMASTDSDISMLETDAMMVFYGESTCFVTHTELIRWAHMLKPESRVRVTHSRLWQTVSWELRQVIEEMLDRPLWRSIPRTRRWGARKHNPWYAIPWTQCKAPGSYPYVCTSKSSKNGLKYAIFRVQNMLLCTRMSHSHEVTTCDSAKMWQSN